MKTNCSIARTSVSFKQILFKKVFRLLNSFLLFIEFVVFSALSTWRGKSVKNNPPQCTHTHLFIILEEYHWIDKPKWSNHKKNEINSVEHPLKFYMGMVTFP